MAFSLPPYYFRVVFWQGLQVNRFDWREGLAQFANLPFLAPFLSFRKQYILNIYIEIFVKLMQYIYWQVQITVISCDSFHTSMRIKLQNKTSTGWRISLGLLRRFKPTSHWRRPDTRLVRYVTNDMDKS